MVSHLRKALRRKSSIHCGSFFFAEIARTTFSSRPFGKVSLSIIVCQPGVYGLEHSHRVSRTADLGKPSYNCVNSTAPALQVT